MSFDTRNRSPHARQLLPRHTVQALTASPIRELANAAMGREDVLPFWFGESDQPTARFIRHAAMESISHGETRYTQNLGRPYLRHGIAEYLSQLHDTPIGMDRVAVTPSGVSGVMLAAQLLLEPGDHVVAITPLWPNLTEIPAILGARVSRFALSVIDGKWSLDVERLLQTLSSDTRMLLLNSPNNPTGWTIREDEIASILHHCRQHGIWILCDDVYERLLYDLSNTSAPSFLRHYVAGDRILSINSFSKAWSMTGWRIGWLVAPPELMDDLAKLIEFNSSCVLEPIQRAAMTALLDGENEVAVLRQRLARTRTLLVDQLKSIDAIELPDAGGAMYVFFRIEGHPDSMVLARQLVNRVGLGLAPGNAFGPEANGWLRWCHAIDPQRLQDGVQRLRQFLDHPPL
ncbi:pyridoxal phosphate-dependent aminotransferase [Pseudomonas sp. MSSRFD41]|uniref:pyridoxal phosphate-dependent aminotransferase n=1 Tax=Pseudomonas sp. MSSRFD41 TaxID=1310370 RepID=UPI00163A2130|nr:pyridoxal phosphate-dependent aminotransferase [Pseudomonas sp. MSSRFD41]MBC2659566.1 pyridoxal phosphate-dependent aminotransferase [Pseudomonas sp. MSSRFD41]